jgi:hypothetical protein
MILKKKNRQFINKFLSLCVEQYLKNDFQGFALISVKNYNQVSSGVFLGVAIKNS